MSEAMDGQMTYATTDGGRIWADTNDGVTYYLNRIDSDGCETAEGMTKVEMTGLVADMAELLGAPEDALWLLEQHIVGVKIADWHRKTGEGLSSDDVERLDRMTQRLHKLPRFDMLNAVSAEGLLGLYHAARGQQ